MEVLAQKKKKLRNYRCDMLSKWDKAMSAIVGQSYLAKKNQTKILLN